jgi:hypothetical protein
LIGPYLIAGILAASVAQDPVVVTSRRDLPAVDQVVTTAGQCGDARVFVSVNGAAETLEVGIGSSRRFVTNDIFPLETAGGNRHVARAFLLCRTQERGLYVHLLFAEPHGDHITWVLRGFVVEHDVSVSRVGEQITLSAQEAAASLD